MAVQNTYIGSIAPVSITADPNGSNIGIGLRVIIIAGVVSLAGATVRGDFVTLTTVEAGKQGEGVSMQSAGQTYFIAAVTISVDDTIYSAANGQITNSSGGGAVLIGKAQSAGATGAAVQVQLENPV